MRVATAALIVSLFLLLWSVSIADGGDGFLFPAWLVCSPLPVRLGLIAIAFVPLIWCLIGWSAVRGTFWLFPLMMLLHYGVAAIEVLYSDKEDLVSARFGQGSVIRWLTLYVMGSTVLWFLFVLRWRNMAKKRRLS